MSSTSVVDKSIHAALISQENDKLKDLLLELKFVLKDDKASDRSAESLIKEYCFEMGDIPAILSHPDVKVRQFGAYCVAGLFDEAAADDLAGAYLKEDVEYNKEHFVKALSLIKSFKCPESLYARMDELLGLLKGSRTDEHKHYVKEVRLLLGLLRSDAGRRAFTGHKLKSEIILTTNRNFREVTMSEVKGFPKKTFNAGVMVMCDDITAIENIRTFEEMLFVPPFDEEEFAAIGSDREVAGRYVREILKPYILERMKVRKDAKKLPVSFRIDIKGETVQNKETELQRFLSEVVEEESGFELINIRNDFDIQIRFVTRKTGVLKPLVKFFVPGDKRFDYKTVDIAAGIKPYLAALICRLCAQYLSEDARVLDPFCGAGTLLVERDRLLRTGFLFGSDIFPTACACAEKNLALAGLSDRSKIINKDFMSLEHKELFNELITDLPFETEKKTVSELEKIFVAFFDRVDKLLEKGSYMFVYTRNAALFKKQIVRHGITMIKCLEISKREGAYLFILRN